MNRNTSLPQDSATNSNLEQHLSHATGNLNASVRVSASNSHFCEKQEEDLGTDPLLVKSAQANIERKEQASFQVQNINQINVLSSSVENYESSTNRPIEMCNSSEKKKQQQPMDSPFFSGRIQPSQDSNEDTLSALHPLHQLSDIALRQLEAVNQTVALQRKDPKPPPYSPRPSQIPSFGSEKALMQTEEKKQTNEKKITKNIKNGEKKVETEKSKMKQKKDNLRKGKWTAEEEEYTMRIIQHFRTGLLTLPDGHTLRSYLAEKLNCDPMRITKKFSGASCLGKRVYNLCDRSQISARDLEMAMAELNELENRFKLRIEHGSSLPFPSRFSDRFRNNRQDLEHAMFLRAGNFLSVNNYNQNHGSGQALEHDNFQALRGNVMDNFGNTDTNLQLALLQNFVTGQNQLGLSMPTHGGANCPNTDSYQNRYQLPNHAETSHFASSSRNTNFNFFDSRQQQHTQVQSHLLSALFNTQPSGYNSIGRMNGQVQQLSLQLQAEALKALASTSSTPFQSQTSTSNSTHDSNSENTHQGSSLSGASATEALAASYKSAAQQYQRSKECEEDKQERAKKDYKSQKTGDTGRILKRNMNAQERSKKVRSQEEQAEGRMLLGFLQELQNNHLKATMSLSNTPQDSLSTGPTLQSTNASSDGTTVSSDTKRYNILKKGYDISVKKDSDMETASSISGFNSSDVPKNEPLSGSSGGSSGGDSSDENKGGSSGDDGEKNIRTGPPRKRFRREFKSCATTQDEDDDFLN